MKMLIEEWFAVFYVILTKVNNLFIYTHLLENIYKHLAWYTNGKIIVIVYVHGLHNHTRIIGQ